MIPSTQANRAEPAPADALVIFGFTGDLASMKTFNPQPEWCGPAAGQSA